MDLYTSDKETTSYSGVRVHDIVRNGVALYISKGGGGLGNQTPAYMVSVKHYDQHLFTITTYEGDKLYDVMVVNNDAEIMAKVFHTAFFHMNASMFINTILMDAYSKGKREGKRETQAKMRDAIGIDDDID